MSWAKVIGILAACFVVSGGLLFAGYMYASSSHSGDTAENGGGKAKASGGKSAQIANLEKSHRAGEKLGGRRLGCIDKSGKKTSANCVDLAGIDLNATDGRKPADMAGGDLSGANLDKANLSWVVFKGANLRGANLDNAKLYRANLSAANLTKANLHGADLLYTDLTNTNLTGANLEAVKNLRQTKLERACLSDPQQPPLNLPAELKPPTRKCK